MKLKWRLGGTGPILASCDNINLLILNGKYEHNLKANASFKRVKTFQNT